MTPPPTSSNLTVAHTRRVSPLVVVAAVLGLVFIGSAALVASLFAPNGRDANVVTAFVLGTIAPTVVGLLALIRGDHAAQIGQANAERLVETAATVEQVAKDVNGHLARHDQLAQKVTNVAEGLARAAGVPVQMRDPASRTRSEDLGAAEVVTPVAMPADSGPLAPDQS